MEKVFRVYFKFDFLKNVFCVCVFVKEFKFQEQKRKKETLT